MSFTERLTQWTGYSFSHPCSWKQCGSRLWCTESVINASDIRGLQHAPLRITCWCVSFTTNNAVMTIGLAAASCAGCSSAARYAGTYICREDHQSWYFSVIVNLDLSHNGKNNHHMIQSLPADLLKLPSWLSFFNWCQHARSYFYYNFHFFPLFFFSNSYHKIIDVLTLRQLHNPHDTQTLFIITHHFFHDLPGNYIFRM